MSHQVKIPIDLLGEMTLQQLYKEKGILEARLSNKEYEGADGLRILLAMLVALYFEIAERLREVLKDG